MSAIQFLAVGDRVRNTLTPHWPTASVIELTPTGGFKYRFDKPHELGPRYGTTDGGEVYENGVASWVRVTDQPGVSTPSTKAATMHQLRHHAETMERGAQEARAMADLMSRMPDPVGPFVIEIARALTPHGLAVINTAAARIAVQALESFEPADEEDDHPYEAAERVRGALDSLKQSIAP